MTEKLLLLANTPQHTETIANWIYYEFVEGILPNISLQDIIRNFQPPAHANILTTVIALENEECVGTASLFKSDLRVRKDLTPWLAALYVRPESRCKGIGRRLIDEILRIARAEGYKTLYLRTEHASDYYKKLGWTLLDELRDENGIQTQVFCKSLQDE